MYWHQSCQEFQTNVINILFIKKSVMNIHKPNRIFSFPTGILESNLIFSLAYLGTQLVLCSRIVLLIA